MSQMTEQVARLIGNRLAGGETVCLPGIGSLQVVFHSARRLSKRTVQPPYRSVEFSSEEQGQSLPALIEHVAVCDPATARTVYDRWLAQVLEGETLTIDGIGTLQRKQFALTEAFDRRLNPHGHAPVQLRRKRRFDWVLFIGILAILLAAAGLGVGYYLKQQRQPVVAQHTATVAHTAPAPVETVSEEPADTEPASSEPAQTPAVTEPEPQPEQMQSSGTEPQTGYTRMQPGRFYVVMGVFTTAENAEHAQAHFAQQQPGWSFRIHLFGSKYLLACHVADTEEAARDFVRQNRTTFPDIWVYAAR